VSTSISTNDAAIHGLMAEFDSAQNCSMPRIRRTKRIPESRAYSPFPVEGLPKRLAFTRTACRWLY